MTPSIEALFDDVVRKVGDRTGRSPKLTGDTASMCCPAHEDRTPESLEGVDLVELIHSDDARQILHVGYGDSLNATDADGESIHDRFLAVVGAHQDEHTELVAVHIGKHLGPFEAAATR